MNTNIKQLILFILFSTLTQAAEFLGPGYVETGKASKLFKDNYFSKTISFYFEDGRFSEKKINSLITEIELRKIAIAQSLCLKQLGECDKEKLNSELEQNSEIIAIKNILTNLEKVKTLGKNISLKNINTPDSQLFLYNLFTALEIYEAIKKGKMGYLEKSPPKLLNFIISRLIPTKIMAGKLEANNLLKEDQFLNPLNLKDTSMLDPPDGAFWKKPNWEINKYDLGPISFKDSLNISNPEEILNPSESIDVELNEDEPLRGYLPEITVNYSGEKWILRFPINIEDSKVGDELKDAFNLFFETNLINSSPVALNMARALGFNVEPKIFKNKIRLYLKGKNGFENAKAELLERINRKFPAGNFSTPFLNNKTDDNNNNYFEIKGVTLQKLNPKKAGVSNLEDLGKIAKREFRGLAVFLAWIDDIGFNDLDVLTNGELRLSDLSLSFGRGLPNYFDSTLVKRDKFKFRALNSKGLLAAITPSDAKWMMNKINQFTSDQIYNGFIQSGFPDLVSKIYVYKLISRRNQLNQMLGIKSNVIEGWTGKISGFEDFFTKDGYLQDYKFKINDSEKENYNINWSSTWMPRKGNIHRSALKKLSLTTLNFGLTIALRAGQLAAGFSNKEFKWRELRLTRHLYGPLCEGNCYYEGVEVGGTAFVPQRILIKNPDTSSSKKYLIVELFRIAVEAHLGQNIESLIGLAPLPIKIGGGISGFYVYEFFRIRPIDDIKSLLTDVKSLFKLPVFSFNKFRDEWLDSAEKGDTMILSSYLGLEGYIYGGPPSIPPGISLLAGFEGKMALTNRLVLQKLDNSNFIANWGNLKNAELNVVLGYDLAGLTDDWWIKAKVNWSKLKEEIYEFDISDKDQRNYLEKNLSALAPRKIPEKLKTIKREKGTIGAGFYIGLKEGLSFSTRSEFGERKLTDFLQNTSSHQFYFERVKIKKFKGEIYETYLTSLDEDNKTRLKIIYSMENDKLDRTRFIDIYGKIQKTLGTNFIPYDLNLIDLEMGNVKFQGMTIFSPEAVEKILNLAEFDVCKSYLNAQGLDEETWRCQEKKYSAPLFAFISDFKQLLSASKKLNANKTRIYSFLKNFTDLLSRYGTKRSSASILKNLLDKKDYFELALMVSDRDPFPGNTSEILIVTPDEQGHYPSITEIATGNADSFSLFSDKLTDALKNYFFYRERAKGVNLTEEIMEDIISKIKFSYR